MSDDFDSSAEDALLGPLSDELPVFARGVSSPIHGKRDIPVKTLLTDEVSEDLRRFALKNGYTSMGDCLRDLIEVTLYGHQHLVSVRQQQLTALARNRSEMSTQGGQQ